MNRIVVPSRRVAAQWFDRAIADDRARAATDLASRSVWTDEIVTPRQLLDQGMAHYGEHRPRLTGASFTLFVADVVADLEPGVRRLFGPGIETSGASASIAAAIAELRMADLSARDLVSCAGSRRLRALAATLDAYERAIERCRWWDDAEAHRVVIDLTRDRVWPPETFDVLEVRGLYDLTPLQGQLLTSLARRASRVRIHVPFDPHHEQATAYAFPYIHLWESVADPQLDIDIVYDEGPLAEAPRDIEIEAAFDPMDECARVADWVRRRADSGCPVEEIGVVVADPARYLPLLSREFDRRGIPWNARRAEALSDSPLFSALLFPLRLIEGRYRRADLMAWTASPLTGHLDPARLRATLAKGPAGDASIGIWKRTLASVQDPAARALVGALNRIDSLGSSEHAPSAFWAVYADILSRVGLSPSTASVAPKAWERWEDALGDLEEGLSVLGRWNGPAVGWRTHRRQLLEAVRHLRLSRGRPGSGVSVLTPLDARGLRFRHQAVIGLAEGALVRPDPAASIFGDQEKQIVNEKTEARLFRTASDRVTEAPLLLFERIRRTDRDVLLTWPGQEEGGDPFLPAQALEVLRGVWVQTGGSDGIEPSTRTWRRDAMAGLVAARQTLEVDRVRFFSRPASERRGMGGPYDGTLGADPASGLPERLSDGPLQSWSPSKLDTWRRCPHQFFQRYVLRLYPMEEQPLEAEANVLGTLAHEAIRHLYQDGLTRHPPDRAGIDAALATAAAAISPADRGDSAVWPILLRRVGGHLHRYFQHLAERGKAEPLQPVGFEVAFNDRGGEMPSIPLETESGRTRLEGRLDRLDRDPDSGDMRVVDYKYSSLSSNAKKAIDEAECGVNQFQLYSYFLGAREWARSHEIDPPRRVTGEIHLVKEPRILGPLESPPDAEVVAAVADATLQAIEGRYDPSPRDPDGCRYCDYRRSCRIAMEPGIDVEARGSEPIPGSPPEEVPD